MQKKTTCLISFNKFSDKFIISFLKNYVFNKFSISWSVCSAVSIWSLVFFLFVFGVKNGMSESLEKLMCGALLDVIKLLFNFDEVCLFIAAWLFWLF